MNIPGAIHRLHPDHAADQGTSESATVNAIIVAIKVGIVLGLHRDGWSFHQTR